MYLWVNKQQGLQEVRCFCCVVVLHVLRVGWARILLGDSWKLGERGPCSDWLTVNRVAAVSRKGGEIMMAELADSRLSQFWIWASCEQLYKCWLSRRRITGAEQPGAYCLLRARKGDCRVQSYTMPQKSFCQTCILGLVHTEMQVFQNSPFICHLHKI